MLTSQRYRRFATAEARGESECYEAWALGVSTDRELLALIDDLPEHKRQPNLIFAAARLRGAPERGFAEFRDWLLANWAQVREVALTHRTQTNEPRRCAVLLPLLAALPQPLALLEVGASAGLCLYPDKFSYRYDDVVLHPRTGAGPAVLPCTTSGPVPIPTAVPEVVWRAGIDLNPLDVTDEDDVRWLNTLVWPEHHERRSRLQAAIELARTNPPRLVTGDLNATVTSLAVEAPSGATLVIFHSAVLPYLDEQSREKFMDTVTRFRGHWIANESPKALATKDLPPASDPTKAHFALALDGTPVAYAGTHGQTLTWFA